MKVVHYTASLNRSSGGVPFAVAGLAKAERELGAEVEVHGGVDGFNQDDELIWRGCNLVKTNTPQGSYGLTREAIAKVFGSKPDILHVHGIWCASSVIGRLAVSRGIATMVAPHGMLDPWILRRGVLKKRVHSAFLEKPLLKRSGVHALNQAEATAVRTFVGAGEINIFTVPNGIELASRRFAEARAGALFLGRMHEKKQVAELMESWGRDPALAGTQLTVAGSGEPAYCRLVAEIAQRFSNVEYVGPVYGTAKDELLARTSWFVLPSQSEGLPMAVLEAIAAGCIPVITPECNMAPLVEQGCAFHISVDFSDFHAIASRLVSMEAEQMSALSDRARVVSQNYAWPKIASKMLESYDQLLNQR